MQKDSLKRLVRRLSKLMRFHQFQYEVITERWRASQGQTFPRILPNDLVATELRVYHFTALTKRAHSTAC